MRAVRWEDSARRQFRDLLTYIGHRNANAAERLEIEFLRKIDMLRRFPEMDRVGRVDGTRELIMHPNYIAIYAVRPETIDVLRILHARQRYP